MPLYEYECKKCKQRFERIQKFSDDPVKKCPQCGGAVEKVISAPAVQFKGSGWYVTDYARKSSAGREDGKPSGESSGSEEKGAKSGKETSEGKPKSDTSESKPKSDTSESKPKSDAKKSSKK
jgi:putative FmdB family regulatory protein